METGGRLAASSRREERTARVVQICVAAGVVASVVRVFVPGLPRPLATISYPLVAAGVGLLALSLPSVRRGWRDHHRVLSLALLAFVGVHVIGLVVAEEPRAVLRLASREGCAAVLFLALSSLPEASRRALRSTVARTAVAIVAAWIVTAMIGAAWDPLGRLVFSSDTHQKLGSLGRLQAWSASPAALGFHALAGVGLIRFSEQALVRRLATIAALVVAIATFSFASLLVPVVLLVGLTRSRIVRWTGTTLLTAAALLALYIHPLELGLGSSTIVVGRLHPAYERSDLGAELHPVHDVGLGPASLRFHTTAYFELVRHAVPCFCAHPIPGIGADNYPYTCPVRALDTVGRSAPERIHNEYAGIVVERGLVGALAAIALIVILRRRYEARLTDRAQLGALVACLLTALSWTVLHEPLFVVLAALVLEPRGSPSGGPKIPMGRSPASAATP